MGRKADEIKKREAELQKYKDAQLLKKSEELGLAFTNHELPPDDGEGEEIEEDLRTTLLSMIPYTKSWYKAKAAEEEMDDLGRIKIEKTKANDFLAMAKGDRSEEALGKLMEDTNNDFFYFNKMRDKMEGEGAFEYKQIDLNPFGDIAANKNRLRRAIRMQFDIVEETGAISFGVTVQNAKDSKKRQIAAQRHAPCSWRGKGPDNTWLHCVSGRMVHPTKTVPNEMGRMETVVLPFCNYHVKECVGDHSEQDPASVLVPNFEGLCTECHLDTLHSRPTPMRADKCPGVAPVSLAVRSKGEKADDAKLKFDVLAEELTEDSICNWRATSAEIYKDPILREYKCLKKVFRDPSTKVLYETCAVHLRHCIRHHQSEATSKILQPNDYGLCSMHHMAEHHIPPPHLTFPYEGMLKKINKKAWMMAAGHWASPRFMPHHNVEIEDYAPKDNGDIIGQVLGFIDRRQRAWRRWRTGWKVVVKCQALWRGFCQRRLHHAMKYKTLLPIRRDKCVVIQTLARQYAAKQYVKHLKILMKKAATALQKMVRGMQMRKRSRIDKAARKIQSLLRKMRIIKFQDAVLMVMQIKIGLRKRVERVKLIQRVFRGYRGRYKAFTKRMYNYIRRRCARLILRTYRAYWKRKTTIHFKYPDESWMQKQLAKRLAKLLCEVYGGYQSRQLLLKHMNMSAPVVQSLVRGFIGRKGTVKMKYLRQALRTWCPPVFAVEFLRLFLESKVFYINERNQQERAIMDAETLSNKKGKAVEVTVWMRKHLPVPLQTTDDIEIKTFLTALGKWYAELGLPLLETEYTPLIAKFRNPVNNRVNVAKLDDYISLHKEPCRVHGRTVCGECCFLRECTKKGCSCKIYHPNGRAGGACVTCVHPTHLHRLCPLQLKQGKMQSLMALVNMHREPDLSIPESVAGTTAETVLGKPPNPYDIYDATLREDHQATLRQTAELTLMHDNFTLKQKLAGCELNGGTVDKIADYWEHVEDMTMTDPRHVGVQGAITVASSLSPSIKDKTPQQFWQSIVAKNPNKNLRDYDEKFEHNLPLAVVSEGQVVYTFEGPKIYINVLLKIIEMEHSVSHDSPDFLRLIMDHILIFERHWRKMVVDIRVGKLNRNVNVSKEARTLFESTAIARPAFSIKLDAVFKQLGFHSKSLSSKSKSTEPYGPFAEKRSHNVLLTAGGSRTVTSAMHADALSDGLLVPSNMPTTRHFQRRPSEPSATLGIIQAVVTREQLTSATSPLKPPRSPKSPKSFSAKDEIDRLNSINSSASFDSMGSNLLESFQTCVPCRPRKGHSFSTTMTGMTGAESVSSKAPFSKKDALLALGSSDSKLEQVKAVEMERYQGGINHRPVTGLGETSSKSLERRGSDTDILRPITAKELQQVMYSTETAARSDYKWAIVTDGNRYVCPFPACGASFRTRDAAFTHLSGHEQKNRLAAAAPLPDSHLHFYWPRNAPWTNDSKFTKRTLPPGAIRCTVQGCKSVFADRGRLDYHLRLIHKVFDLSSIVQSYIEGFEGDSFRVPPFDPPREAPLKYCPIHVLATGKCPLCIEVELTYGPKAPIQFYENFTINFEKRHQAEADKVVWEINAHGSSTLLQESYVGGGYNFIEEKGIVNFAKFDTTKGIYFLLDRDVKKADKQKRKFIRGKKVEEDVVPPAKVYKGRPVALAVDKHDVAWIAIQPFLSHTDMEKYLTVNNPKLDSNVAPSKVATVFHLTRDFDIPYELLAPSLETFHTVFSAFQGNVPFNFKSVEAHDGHSVVSVKHMLHHKIASANDTTGLINMTVGWIKVHQVVGRFHLKTNIPKSDFRSLVKTGQAPKKNSYFLRS